MAWISREKARYALSGADVSCGSAHSHALTPAGPVDTAMEVDSYGSRRGGGVR
jgi:hypothetical protein